MTGIKNEKMDAIMGTVERLDSDLKEFDVIFAILRGGRITEDWGDEFSRVMQRNSTSKNVLVLSDMDIILTNSHGFEYRRLSEEECRSLRQLYTMYDFSDRFFMISEESQYGSLLNYVKTGIITNEEALQVFAL